MEELNGSSWDVLIAGTGIQQSLLALALSRSGKKILQTDKHDYYGQSEAALSLQEAEAWVTKVNDEASKSPFSKAVIKRASAQTDGPNLGPSRSYSLALAPGLIYTRSNLLPSLVSAHIHEQVDFQAIGSWFVYENTPASQPSDGSAENASRPAGRLARVANSREDIFADTSLNLRAKGALVKFLRFVSDYEKKTEEWESYKDEPFPDFLSKKFKIPADLHGPLMALTTSTLSPQQTTTGFAIARIANHLRSIGLFGPGFSTVLPKYGGLSEVIQVACRSGAVGGATYVLNKSIESVEPAEGSENKLSVRLDHGDTVSTSLLIATDDQLPTTASSSFTFDAASPESQPSVVSRSISIVSSSLRALFPPLVEGSPAPAGAVIIMPTDTLKKEVGAGETTSPIHIFLHSSETGECPANQCVIYATIALALDTAEPLLDLAMQQLVASVGESPTPSILWSMTYEQKTTAPTARFVADRSLPQTYLFEGPSLDSVYDDQILGSVKEAYKVATGSDGANFLQFDDRNNPDD